MLGAGAAAASEAAGATSRVDRELAVTGAPADNGTLCSRQAARGRTARGE